MENLSDLKVKYFAEDNKDYLNITGSTADEKEVEFYKICLNKFALIKNKFGVKGFDAKGGEAFIGTDYGYSVTFPLYLNDDNIFFKIKDIVKELTLEEIEEQLGYKIKIIEK